MTGRETKENRDGNRRARCRRSLSNWRCCWSRWARCRDFFAGLFGIGGGAILVPVFYECFRLAGVPLEVRMPLCIGTSLAIIIPTSIRSFRAHYARGAVDMEILKRWWLPIVIGVIAGSVTARYAPERLFKIVFVMVAWSAAARLLLARDGWKFGDEMPKGPLMGSTASSSGCSRR